MGRLSNIPLSDFRAFLIAQGLQKRPAKGGHEKWVKKGLLRPVVLQTHIDPIPEFIVRNNLRVIGVKEDVLLQFLGR